MHLTEQSLSALAALKKSSPDAASSRELASTYWTALSQGIAECVRSKGDLAAYLESEGDFINFGLAPEVLQKIADLRSSILQKSPAPPFCSIMLFSGWLVSVCSKILEGDKRELLEKEIKVLAVQNERLQKETVELQTQRKESIRQELSKTSSPSKPADLQPHLDNLEKIDAILRQNFKFKKAVSKGVFFSVAEKRAYCERENTMAGMNAKADDFLNALPPKERLAIKECSIQISENLGRVVDCEDNIDKLKKDCLALQKKKESVSPLEIEARITKEIDYVRDLVRLAARRLHMETCPFIRDGDTYFTLRELASCIERVLEFDPAIFHNGRAAIFGKPSILLVPGTGNSLYDWKNNIIIVPLAPPSGNFMASIASGAIEYRLDTDEDKKLLVSYNRLPGHENVKSSFLLRADLTKDYVTWMTSEYKGYKNLDKDTRKWFEHEIAPSRNDIYVPPQYQPFELSAERFTAIVDECELKLSGGMESAPEEDLWTASILNYQRGKFERSAELLRALVAKNPLNQRALYNLGYVTMKLMYKQEAIRSFKEYAKLNPQSWWTGVVMDNVRRLQSG